MSLPFIARLSSLADIASVSAALRARGFFVIRVGQDSYGWYLEYAVQSRTK